VRDRLGRAYNRTTLLEQRRSMLQRWADYLDILRDGVVALKSGGGGVIDIYSRMKLMGPGHGTLAYGEDVSTQLSDFLLNTAGNPAKAGLNFQGRGWRAIVRSRRKAVFHALRRQSADM